MALKRSSRSIENIMMDREGMTEQEKLEAGIVDNSGKAFTGNEVMSRGNSLYDSSVHPRQAYTLTAQMGATLEDMARVFDVSQKTIVQWMRRYNEFAQAIREGRDAFTVNKIEQSLVKRALGYSFDEVSIKETQFKVKGEDGVARVEPIIEKTVTTKQVAPDVAAIIFYLKNRASVRWKDKQEIVTIEKKEGNVRKVLRNMSVAELRALQSTVQRVIENGSTVEENPAEEVIEADIEERKQA